MRAFAFGLCLVLVPAPAAAEDVARAPDANIEIAPQPPSVETKGPGAPSVEAGGMPAEEPPSRPGHKGLVLESTLGVLVFGGQFRHVAPPASFMHAQLGFELLSWLMIFGDGDLAFTNTSESESASDARAFPLWGFGGGIRVGPRIGRFGVFVQADVGALSAQVPHDALAYLGFRHAESLGASFGAKVGVEWYARDRHLALTLQGGPRLAQGFAKFADSADVPLMWDVAAGLRYTF